MLVFFSPDKRSLNFGLGPSIVLIQVQYSIAPPPLRGLEKILECEQALESNDWSYTNYPMTRSGSGSGADSIRIWARTTIAKATHMNVMIVFLQFHHISTLIVRGKVVGYLPRVLAHPLVSFVSELLSVIRRAPLSSSAISFVTRSQRLWWPWLLSWYRLVRLWDKRTRLWGYHGGPRGVRKSRRL